MKPFINFIMMLLALALSHAAHASAESPACTYAKDYVTTLEYLRAQKSLAMPEPDARKMALAVTHGCSGAAVRFIRVTKMLLTAGLTGADATQTGLEFSAKPDSVTESFLAIFSIAFSKDYLDLDIKASNDLARSLSSEFSGDSIRARDDFQTLTEYCIRNFSILQIQRQDCAPLALRVSKKGESWGGGVADSYIRLLDFLRSDRGANLSTPESLKTAEDLIAGGPGVTENFMQAYRYGISSKGLNYPIKEALVFARELALQK